MRQCALSGAKAYLRRKFIAFSERTGPSAASFRFALALETRFTPLRLPEVDATRATLTARFRHVDARERGQLYLDPRLPEGTETAALGLLAQARVAAARGLRLEPPAPQVFVYFGQQPSN